MYFLVRSQMTAAGWPLEKKVARMMMTEQTNEDWMKHIFPKDLQWITHAELLAKFKTRISFRQR